MTKPGEFKENFADRLQHFLSDKFGENFNAKIELLTPDASTREYFRINWENKSAIACVYPAPFAPEEQSYLDTTNLFAASGLPVAEIYDYDGAQGVIIHEDFGNQILRPILKDASEKDKYLNQGIRLIAEIQAATSRAFELDSIASRLSFDFEKLSWELDFFAKHYFETFRQTKLSSKDLQSLRAELDLVAAELAARPQVLAHRDFHAANLMIDRENRLRIIDHQDARMGAASYDLVSLLLDRIDAPPANNWIEEKQQLFLAERARIGLEKIDAAELTAEFRLQTIQRCLKAIGTFSYQTAARGKTGYAQYIEPMFQMVLEAARQLERFPNLQTIIQNQIK